MTLEMDQRLPSSIVKFLLCFVCVFSQTFVICKSNKDATEPLKSLQHVEVMDPLKLNSIRDSSRLSVVYFFNSVVTHSRENFLQAFDNSAKYLEAYNIALIVINCMESKVTLDECQGVNIIATYQNGVEFIKLDIDTMFDIDSIMANSMQLLLLREVPIIESQADRETLQASLLGKQDLIFFYTRAIGTMEHRVFMEIAYTYQDQFKFAVSTRLETIRGLSDEEEVQPKTKSGVWTLHCSKMVENPSGSNACQSVLYRGSLTLSTIADYMERLPQPNLFFAPENGTTSLLQTKSDLPVIFVYTNKKLKQHSDDVSTGLSYDVKGFAKVVVVDVDNKECQEIALSQGFDGLVPRVAVAIPDGNFTFMDKQDKLHLSEIRHFLSTVATVPTKPGEEIVNATDGLTGTAKNADVDPVEVQDDEVAKAVFKPGREKPKVSHVPAVLKDTFEKIVNEAPLRVVLYYLPYDAVSMAFLMDFDKAAQILKSSKNIQDTLAIVNCYDATDLCAREKIVTYPDIRIHRKGLPYQTYEGPLDSEFIVKAVGLLRHEFPRKLQNMEELNRFVAGDFPTRFTDLTPSSVVFVAAEEDKESWSLFREASKRLAPFVAMGEVHGVLMDFITKKYNTVAPCVVSFHHTDSIQPVRKMSQVSNVDDLVVFVKQAMITTMPELTAVNFPVLHSKKLPFVILFLNQSDLQSKEARTTFNQVASGENFKDSIFCWMDAQNQTMGMVLLKEYTQNISTPTIAVVNHKQAQVFTHHTPSLESNDVIQWLTGVFGGQEKPSKILEDKNWSPPGPHYDFLKMIDEDFEGIMEDEPTQTGNKKVTSGFKVDLKKEEEVRERLLDRHRDHANTDASGTPNGGSSGEATVMPDEKEHNHNHEEL